MRAPRTIGIGVLAAPKKSGGGPSRVRRRFC